METDEKTCGWFVFYKDQLLIERKEATYSVPFGPEPPVPVPAGNPVHLIGCVEGCPAKAYSLAEPVPGNENGPYGMKNLRASFDLLPLAEYQAAGKAFQILDWDLNSRFCPRCGVPTVHTMPIAKQCPVCRQEIYPRITPAILVLIRKGESILLVHARNFRGSFFGLVAGFLEPGESAEECVYREVREETGLQIRNLRYVGSQSWPYPGGIMLGFTADYESGELILQKEELSSGGFYTRDHLPEIPLKLSLARKLIDDWLAESYTKSPDLIENR